MALYLYLFSLSHTFQTCEASFISVILSLSLSPLFSSSKYLNHWLNHKTRPLKPRPLYTVLMAAETRP